MELHFKTIPHKDQRYETVGDYYEENGVQEFRVSDMKNKDYEFLIFLHEAIEQYLTAKKGIKEEDITAFDEAYEAKRQEGDFTEPGDDKNAPYYAEHQFATGIERILAAHLGVDWEAYDKTVCEL